MAISVERGVKRSNPISRLFLRVRATTSAMDIGISPLRMNDVRASGGVSAGVSLFVSTVAGLYRARNRSTKFSPAYAFTENPASRHRTTKIFLFMNGLLIRNAGLRWDPALQLC